MLRQGKTNEELIQFLTHLSMTQTAALWTHREIAAAEMRLQHWEAAVGHLLKAVKLRERDAVSWENLGVCFFNVGRLDSAKKATSRALAIDPASAYGNALMAWLGGPGATSGLAQRRSEWQHQRRVRAPRHDLELLSEAYRHFKDAMRHLLKGAVRTSLESLEACGELAALCNGNIIAASKLLGDVAFLQLKLERGGQTGGHRAIRRYAKAIHLAPNQACLYRNLCTENPRLVAPEIAVRCLEASLRLSMEGGGGGLLDVGDAGSAGELESSWSAIGTRRGSRYALIRALMLDRKDFQAWQALEGLASTSEEERAYCRMHVKQLHREEKDIFARILASKMDPESPSSDLFSRMQVAEIIGPELMSVYLSDASNPMRSTVAELVNLLSFGSVVDVNACVADDGPGDGAGGEADGMDVVEEGDRKRRHQMPWKAFR